MPVHLISYDLRAPGKDFVRLQDHLKTYPAKTKPLESLRLIKTPLSAVDLREAISKLLDSKDKLLVVNVSSSAAVWKNLPDNVAAWIKKISPNRMSNQHVVKRDDGWAVRKERADRDTRRFDTQAEAIQAAREIAINQGSEVFIHDRDGKIRERNTYGDDPNPPKG